MTKLFKMDDASRRSSLKDDCSSNGSSAVAKAGLSENTVESDVISVLIGDIGRWQIVWALLLALFQMSPAFQVFGFSFQNGVKDFWCARPDNAPNMDVAVWRKLSQPQGACLILDLNYTQLPELSFPPDIVSAQLIPCTKFEFSQQEPHRRSLIEEFSLVCDRVDFLYLMEMSFLIGAALGSVASGWISDRFGRKHVLMIFVVVQAVSGTIVAYSVNVAMYMALRVLLGFATATLTSVSLVLVLELVSGKWRTVTGILGLLPIPITFILMGCIAFYVRDWRNLQLIMSLPFLSFLLIWYCMPESPRWLLARGRFNELNALLKRAARLNRCTLPSNYQKLLEVSFNSALSNHSNDQTLMEQQPKKRSPEEGTNNCAATNNKLSYTIHENPFKIVFNRFYWFTTVLNLIVWGTLVIIYFGLSLHLGNLGGDLYLNTMVAGAIEIVSICVSIFVVLKFGLRRSLIFYMLVPGVLCLATTVLPNNSEDALPVVSLAIIARCFIGANNAILPAYTALQYPTVVRNFALGLGSFASGVSLIGIPYIWKLVSFE